MEHPEESENLTQSFTFFKPYFKDYEHQFKIIKSSHDRDRGIMNQSLIFQILEVFDKDINNFIKNLEEVFKKGDNIIYFSKINIKDVDSKIMNKIIPEFIFGKNNEYTFEQVTLCLHFLFNFLHKIKKVPENFYYECILLLLILNSREEFSGNKENEEKKLVEKKYLYDLTNLILLYLNFCFKKLKKNKFMNDSLVNLELANVYSRSKTDLKDVKLDFTNNSFLFVDHSPIAKEKSKKFKLGRLMLKLLFSIISKYKILDQSTNLHKEFLNSFLNFTFISYWSRFFCLDKTNEKNTQNILKQKISLKSLNRVNKYILKIFEILLFKYKIINHLDKEKLCGLIKTSFSIIIFNFIQKFEYEINHIKNIIFDVSKMILTKKKDDTRNNPLKKEVHLFLSVQKNELHEVNFEFNKNNFLIRTSEASTKNLERGIEVKYFLF